MRKSNFANHLVVSVLLLELAMPAALVQSSDEVAPTVSDPRPLGQAAQLLQSKLGVAISYEDISWVYGDDFARARDTAWGKGIAQSNPHFRAVIPVGGSLEIRLSVDPISRKPLAPISNILQDLVDSHVARGNPGVFRLVTLGTDFSIVPSAGRDKTGKMVTQQSPLDFPISFEEGERSGLENLKTVCRVITVASGQKVELGSVPINLLLNTVTSVGANNEMARDVLVRVFRELRWVDSRNLGQIPKLSWRLLFGPDDQVYVLNVRSVEQEIVDPSGAVRLLPVAR